MSAGSRVDYELTNINRVAGNLVLMVIRKKLWRSTIEEAATQLEESARVLRDVIASRPSR
jgi:hypothetical protein